MVFRRLEPSVVRFLEDLRDNNNRPWFRANKDRYECEVLEPCLSFIRAFSPRLRKISPFFVASDERVGGSLMRVYRDTRFGKDKTPYKTNVGIQFRHELGGDVHAPGFYIHIGPMSTFSPWACGGRIAIPCTRSGRRFWSGPSRGSER